MPRRFGVWRNLPVALSLFVACETQAPPPRTNVLLISIDTLRADRLGAYGATRVQTPSIDGLARTGVRFERAYTPVPLTLPAHWTILTGVEPWRHGVVDNGMTVASSPVPTLAERFKDAGYDTAAFVAAFVLHRTFGLSRGFERYDDGPAGDAALEQVLHSTGTADERVDRALAWLREDRKAPFFLWLHLYDPHAPYAPPEGFRARYEDRPYDGEIAFVDTQVARMLRALDRSGATDQTLVVLLSDHGESLGEHGEQTHGVLLYDATLRVPLIARLPGKVDGGRKREDPVTLADVAPTILALAGLPPSPGLDGRNLFGHDLAPRSLAAISVYPERRLGWARMVAIRDDGWKLTSAPRPELFDVTADPGEVVNKIDAEGERASRMTKGAHSIEATLDATLNKRGSLGPSAEDRARLSALGYVSAVRSGSGPAPDPKDVISTMNDLDSAYQLFAEGRLDEAESKLKTLLAAKSMPKAPVLEALARLARVRGRDSEAESTYLRLLQMDDESVAALAQLIVLARKRGDHGIEIERARRLIAIAPKDSGASRLLAEALFAALNVEGAEKEWRRGLTENPGAGWLRLSFARFLKAQGRFAEAGKELDVFASADLPADLNAAVGKLRAELATH